MELEIKNLSYRYEDDEKDTLHDISFSVHGSEWITIIGHNGSGKSTLSKILVGILYPSSGFVYVNGLKLDEENIYEIRKHIGIVFQNPDNQFVATSVEDDIAFGLENLEVPQKDMKGIIDSALEAVSMSEFKDQMPSNLSGGQKQRVAIAGLLAINPDLFIMDEATSMLDPKGREDFIEVVKKLKQNGKTIINITHDMSEAMLSDRCIILSDGEILKDDKTMNVMMDIDTLKKAKLETPSELYIYHELKKNNYSNEEVLNALWELASKK